MVLTSSRLALLTIFLLAVSLVTVSLAAYAIITPELDNSRVQVWTPFVLKINMSQAVTEILGVTTVSLNITIPAGYSVVYALIVYDDGSGAYTATPVNITWDEEARNLTINVQVSSATGTAVDYNDLNVTLVLVAETSATGTLEAQYYYNASNLFSPESVTLEVNATTMPVGFTEGLSVSLNYNSVGFIIAGPVSLEYIGKLLNTTSETSSTVQLVGYVNATMLGNKVVRVCANQTVTGINPGTKFTLYTPTEITANFGANSTSVDINGLLVRFYGLPVTGTIYAPATGSYDMVILDRVPYTVVKVNASYVVLAGSQQIETAELNASKLAAVYLTKANTLRINATGDGMEAVLMNVTVGTLYLTNASSVKSATAYIGLSWVGTLSTDTQTAWSAEAYVTYIGSSSNIKPDMYGSDIYQLLKADKIEPHVKLSLPPSAGGDVNVTAEAELDLTSWLKGTISVNEFSSILVYKDAVSSVKGYAYLLLPTEYAPSVTYTFTTTNPVTAVQVTIGSTVTREYAAGGATSISVVVNNVNPFRVCLCAPQTSESIAATGFWKGYSVGIVNVTLAPSLLIADGNQAYNVSLTGLPLENFIGVAVSYDTYLSVAFDMNTPYGSSSELNVTLKPSITGTIGKPIYNGINVSFVARVKNVTGSYTLSAKVVLASSGTELEKVSSQQVSINEHADKVAAYIDESLALAMYTTLFADLDKDVYSVSNAGLTYWYNSSIASQLPGVIIVSGKLSISDKLAPATMGGINVSKTPADTKFALIGEGAATTYTFDLPSGIATASAKIVLRHINISVPLKKVCLYNVIVEPSEGVYVNSTSGWTGEVSVKLAYIHNAKTIAFNLTRLVIHKSRLEATDMIVNVTSGVIADSVVKLSNKFELKDGTLVAAYDSLSALSVSVAGGAQLKIILPVSFTDAFNPYVVEKLPVNQVAYSNVTEVTATQASVSVGVDNVVVSYTTAPTQPTFVTVAEMVTMVLPPGKGYKKVIDVVVTGAAPSKVVIDVQLSPTICSRIVNPKLIASNTKVYYYEAGRWKPAKAGIAVDNANCRLSITFNSTTTPSASKFAGLPIGITAPTSLPFVGLEGFEPYRLVTPETILAVYLTVAALLAGMAVAYALGARRA